MIAQYMKPTDVDAGIATVIAQLEANAAACHNAVTALEANHATQVRIYNDALNEMHRIQIEIDRISSEGVAALAKAKKLYEAKDA